MSDKPILFSAPTIRAILAGRKTQTRRIVKPQPVAPRLVAGIWVDEDRERHAGSMDGERSIARFAAGDRLWVGEAWANVALPGYPPVIFYRADDRPGYFKPGTKWKPSIHMRREHSRITLAVTEVRIERLQDISVDDAIAEGCTLLPDDSPGAGFWIVEGAPMECCAEGVIECYERLWESINGAGSWEANPWVAATTFVRVTP